MDRQQIEARLKELSEIAERRMDNMDTTFIPDSVASIDFMTYEEKIERHKLIKQLPSKGELIKEAKMNIKKRTDKRNNRAPDKRKHTMFTGRRIDTGLYEAWEAEPRVYVEKVDDVIGMWDMYFKTDDDRDVIFKGGSKNECFEFLNDNWKDLGIKSVGPERKNAHILIQRNQKK